MELHIKFQVLKSISYYNAVEIEAGDADRVDTDETICEDLNELLGYEDLKWNYPIGTVNSMGAISHLGWLPAVAFDYDAHQDYDTGDWEVSSMYISPFCDIPDNMTEMQKHRLITWLQSWLDWLMTYNDWDVDTDDDYNLTEASAPPQILRYNENQLEIQL